MPDNKKSIKKALSDLSLIKQSSIWKIFFVLLFLSSVVIGAISGDIISKLFEKAGFYVGLIVASVIFVWGSLKTIKEAWSQVPQNHIWIIEVFGKAVAQKEAGLCFLFPWFGFVSPFEVYLGEQQMRLFMDELESASANPLEFKGLGDVEFTNGSAPVFSTVYFKVIDEKKAAYNIENLYTGIEEKLDSAVRSFLGQYSIDEANVLKSRVCLVDIMNGDYIIPTKEEAIKPQPFTNQKELEEKLQNCMLWKYILDEWGTKITHIAISDINLSDSIKKAREKVLLAEKDAEAAVYKGKERTILAAAEEKALEKEGAGYARQVKQLTKVGMEPNSAAAYLDDRLKWNNVGTKGATVIDSGGGGIASLGAQFAVGMKIASDSDLKKSEKKKVLDKTKDEKGEAV